MLLNYSHAYRRLQWYGNSYVQDLWSKNRTHPSPYANRFCMYKTFQWEQNVAWLFHKKRIGVAAVFEIGSASNHLGVNMIYTSYLDERWINLFDQRDVDGAVAIAHVDISVRVRSTSVIAIHHKTKVDQSRLSSTVSSCRCNRLLTYKRFKTFETCVFMLQVTRPI